MRAGLAYMPADRGRTALVRTMSITDNLMLRDSDRAPFARGGFLTRRSAAAKARTLMADFDIRAPGPGSIAARLEDSGDPWRTMTRHRRGLAAARRRLAALSATPV